MRLEKRRVRTERWYTIGYSLVLGGYVLAVTVGWLGNYDRYYSVSEEEYLLGYSAPEKLDELADSLFRAANSSDRFICSEKADENTNVQNELAQRLVKDKNDYYEKHPEAITDFERF